MSELADSLEGELDSSRSPVTDEAVMSIIEQISVLTPEQKEKVRRAILFGSSANLFKIRCLCCPICPRPAMALRAVLSFVLASCWLQLARSTRLSGQAHSSADGASGERGKCELDTAEFYWEYDKIAVSGLSFAVMACMLTLSVWSATNPAKRHFAVFVNAVIGVACIFLPYIAGNLAKSKLVAITCHQCHCDEAERSTVVDQASLCILFAIMSKTAVAANVLGILDLRTISSTGHPIDDLLRERGHVNRYLVVVSSLSLDWKELIKIPGVSNYELRLLWHLYFLRSQAMRIVMCTSQYIPEALINYYLRYLPSDVSPKEARSRLTTIACNDMTAASVTNKLLSRKRALNRIRDAIEPEKAAMTCFNSTDSEVQLAEELGIPLFGTDTQGAFWGTKTGNRQVFRDAGVLHPDGSYDLIYTEEELCEEILSLLRRCPSTKKVMVKLNDSFSGEGNAVLRVDSELVDSLKESDEQAMDVIFDRLENSLEYVAPGLTWDKYYQQFQTLGGICELFIEGQSSAKTSPSCQAFLNADGSVRILATHEQMLNGQIYTGCTFPAKEEYSAELVSLTKKIGQELVGRQVVGYIAVDFVSVRQSDGSYKHWAIEVNVRMGGTTLPIMTLNFLCRDGRLNEQTSEFIASDGKPRFYVASDTLRKKTYKGLVIEDLLAIIERHSSEIEWNKRPGAPETGTIFHLVTLLSELGKCGCVCIGRSLEEAQQIFRRVQDILDAEARPVEVPPTEKAVAAELDLVIEELEGDEEDGMTCSSRYG
ncbi:besA [Symbiodinium necroappetens]|uniref:BesA protein n=1 Tax=Symbiodinium necroappetens TaxID=1628268 RepID=A0A813B3Q1_9DINO|nr:besA [Symbiodinium necroappetens]